MKKTLFATTALALVLTGKLYSMTSTESALNRQVLKQHNADADRIISNYVIVGAIAGGCVGLIKGKTPKEKLFLAFTGSLVGSGLAYIPGLTHTLLKYGLEK